MGEGSPGCGGGAFEASRFEGRIADVLTRATDDIERFLSARDEINWI